MLKAGRTIHHPFTERIETRGHLVDSGLMSRIFGTIIRDGAEFQVLDFSMGGTNDDPSYARHEIGAPSAAELEHVLAKDDINPAVVTKLADRETAHALGVVTDVGLFLHLLAQELGSSAGR